MNKTIASLIERINELCESNSIKCMTGGIIPYYESISKKGNVPAADVYVDENRIGELRELIANDENSDISVIDCETASGRAFVCENKKTTFIDLFSSEKQVSFGMNVCVLPLRSDSGIVSFLNANRQMVSCDEQLIRNVNEKEHCGTKVFVPENTDEYMELLYEKNGQRSIREYFYGNCIFSEEISYNDLGIDLGKFSERIAEQRANINGNSDKLEKDRDYCDAIFDEIRGFFDK